MADSDDDLPVERRRSATRQSDLNVIQFQIGSIQTAMDRMERAMEKGFTQLVARLDDFDKRLALIERRQEYDAARLKSLEEFRNEQDRRAAEDRNRKEAELKVAVDQSDWAKTVRTVAAVFAGVVTTAAVVATAIVAISGGS